MWFRDALWQTLLLTQARDLAPFYVLDSTSATCFQGSFSPPKDWRRGALSFPELPWICPYPSGVFMAQDALWRK